MVNKHPYSTRSRVMASKMKAANVEAWAALYLQIRPIKA